MAPKSGIGGSSSKRRLQLPLWLFGSAVLALAGCATPQHRANTQAADHNRATLYTLPLDLFGRPETGWAVYAPWVALTVGASTAADTPGFADAVARWRRDHHLGAGGEVDAALLNAMKQQWQDARPFVRLRATGVCPPPPSAEDLATLDARESLGGRPLLLRRDALDAYRRMVSDARKQEPALAARLELLQVFSAYRSPERDAARCAAQTNCQGVVRAACSAHRTGLALDLVLDTAQGQAVDSSVDANRLAMVRGLAYRWLLANGPSHGFVNYPFEPWHWEWTKAREEPRAMIRPAGGA